MLKSRKARSTWCVVRIRDASWFVHCVCEKMCLIWVDVSFVHSSHLVRQLGGKLTHQSKLYVSDSTNLFDTFTHDAPRIRTTHHVNPALDTFFHTHDARIMTHERITNTNHASCGPSFTGISCVHHLSYFLFVAPYFKSFVTLLLGRYLPDSFFLLVVGGPVKLLGPKATSLIPSPS